MSDRQVVWQRQALLHFYTFQIVFPFSVTARQVEFCSSTCVLQFVVQLPTCGKLETGAGCINNAICGLLASHYLYFDLYMRMIFCLTTQLQKSLVITVISRTLLKIGTKCRGPLITDFDGLFFAFNDQSWTDIFF